jgi:hypothetical protein
MDDFVRSPKQASATPAVHGVSGNGLAENMWPWFIGFCGMLTIFLYREALRLMLWARSLNY